MFLLSETPRSVLGLTQPPISFAPGVLSAGVKWSGCDAEHMPPSTAIFFHMLSYCGIKLNITDNSTLSFTLFRII